MLAEISSLLAGLSCNLTEVNQHTDTEEPWFFLRVEFESTASPADHSLQDGLAQLASTLGASWSLRPKSKKYKLAVMCSRDGHCLADLIWRWRSGSLPFDLVGVVSNHDTLRPVVEREGVPFCTVAISGDKNAAFQKVAALLESWGSEVVVLARYMQILPPWLCRQWESRVINIHHSFLPAFPGASPYMQAYQRGVKIIGATCHYVTAQLDEGPIIEQEVLRVSHTHNPADLVQAGQDCERLALSRGLGYHLEDRVFCHGAKTVVFTG